MGDDFPAAHSMDTTWFAVDALGHVGCFLSGENGHVPEGAEETDISHQLWEARHPDQAEEFWWRLPREELANELGVFYYEYDDEYNDEEFIDIRLYRLIGAPRSPLHIDQLPPELRQRCKQTRFDKLNFVDAEQVQPMEQFRCSFWYAEGRVAYLCSDGKTVRPIPGKEDRFADFCKQFREEKPKIAKKLIFEGLAEEPKKPRRRRHKENNDGK